MLKKLKKIFIIKMGKSIEAKYLKKDNDKI